ncbi:hypothetical protein LCGC14_1964980, partial [marine sediment metagenome]
AKIAEIKKGVDERLQGLEFGRVLQEGGTGELDAGQMFNVIAGAELPSELKFGLLDRLAKGELGLEVAEGFEDLDVFDIASGRKTSIKVPEAIAQGTKQEQDKFFEERGFDVTTQPRPLLLVRSVFLQSLLQPLEEQMIHMLSRSLQKESWGLYR